LAGGTARWWRRASRLRSAPHGTPTDERVYDLNAGWIIYEVAECDRRETGDGGGALGLS